MKHLKTLFIGAHTDDIEFGAGCFIQQQENKDCLIFSKCQESIPAGMSKMATTNETTESMKRIGCNYSLRDLPVRRLHEHRSEIRETLHDLQKKYKYELIVTHCSFDTHQDHQVVHEECKRVFKDASILGYFEPKNNYSEKADFYHIVDEGTVNVCCDLLYVYKSQLAKYDYIEAKRISLLFYGMKIGQTFAEPFEVIRWINK